ncbi:MAG: DUF4391 domain-containing protein [Clostridium sp.]|uniref:DUF4391 domain-containing protein n=1 Tax=Clostridium TaxID=1485 RepID=UPI0006E6354B|nr:MULTISPECIES: DUF4391 domain-containing protein [Clostridium]KQB76844.1 hypothetical protein AK964_20850 [Clostridium butyricum]MBS4840773.1 DUF4391 domain-containing protein [Clostridium sp.]MDB2137615.1 DUF4391 domain-containing protein [Clostridium butyricum]
MLGINEKYKVNKKISISTFINKDLDSKEKSRLREYIKSIVLTFQISGEEIVSVVNEKVNCQVIMFFDVEIKNIKNARYVGEILQRQIKPLCLIRLFDDNKECYCFAEKRLNELDKNEIVIDSIVLTKSISLYFSDNIKELLNKYLTIRNLKNFTDKYTIYMESMIKAYIISNPQIYPYIIELLESKIWYTFPKYNELYRLLKNIDLQQTNLIKCNETKEKIKINELLKKYKDEIKCLVCGGIKK